jgi:multidrug transporter EmrE-like cation transporter
MNLLLLIAASAAYSAGGLSMKLSDGLTRVGPSVALFVLFAAGAAMQAVALRRVDLGVGYVFVLGLEAVLTVVLSVAYLHEGCPPQRIAAIVLVVAGIAWLRAS